MANINLRRGDCFEYLKSIPDNSVDCVVTDPPYGNTNCFWDCVVDEKTLLQELERVTKPNRAICVFCMLRMAVRFITHEPGLFRYELVWAKNHVTGYLSANKRPLRAHELILVFSDGEPLYNPQFTFSTPYKTKRNGYSQIWSHYTKRVSTVSDGRRYPKSVIECRNCNSGNNIHPTSKPVELIEYLVRTYSNSGDLVLDPFAGSGTTAVACVNSGRDFIGFELDEGYYNAALKRIEEAKINKAESLPIEY